MEPLKSGISKGYRTLKISNGSKDKTYHAVGMVCLVMDEKCPCLSVEHNSKSSMQRHIYVLERSSVSSLFVSNLLGHISIQARCNLLVKSFSPLLLYKASSNFSRNSSKSSKPTAIRIRSEGTSYFLANSNSL